MRANLGETRQRKRRRSADPMQAYDSLPAPLRGWLAEAALPWSPASVRRVWHRARGKGLAPEEVLHLLDRCEAASLQRERAPCARTRGNLGSP